MIYAYSLKDFGHIDRMVIPWKGGSSPLVSLLDMIKIGVGELSDLMRELEALKGLSDSSQSEFTPEDIKKIKKVFDKASYFCKLFGLESSSRLIKLKIDFPVNFILSWCDLYIPELGTNFSTLYDFLQDELHERLFMFIPQKDAEWYEKKDGFGERVSDAFCSAINDIKEAGTCYATGRYTACVFHAMRVLEHGLRVLAKNVDVTIGRRGWGKIIGRIEVAINPPPSQKSKLPKTKEEIERHRFLSEAATEFRYFKDAWRDYVTHNPVDYKGPEALRIMDHVKDFMAHLSNKLKE